MFALESLPSRQEKMVSDHTKLLFQRHAGAHRNICIFGTVGCTFASVFFAWLSVWAGHQHGWEATPAAMIFGAGLAAGIIGLVYFATHTWSWYSYYASASGSLELYESDPATFWRSYREVMGPLRWKN